MFLFLGTHCRRFCFGKFLFLGNCKLCISQSEWRRRPFFLGRAQSILRFQGNQLTHHKKKTTLISPNHQLKYVIHVPVCLYIHVYYICVFVIILVISKNGVLKVQVLCGQMIILLLASSLPSSSICSVPMRSYRRKLSPRRSQFWCSAHLPFCLSW